MPESEPSVEEQQQYSAAANSTAEQDQGYLTLPSDESDQEMEGQQGNPLDAVMQQLQQMKLELQEVKKQQQDNRKKEDQQSYAQTWETCANPETHDPIARVVAKLERAKVKDGTLEYLQYLKDKRDAGEVDANLYSNLSKAEGNWKGQGFVESLPLAEQESGRKLILPENAYDMSGSVQAVYVENHDEESVEICLGQRLGTIYSLCIDEKTWLEAELQGGSVPDIDNDGEEVLPEVVNTVQESDYPTEGSKRKFIR